MTGPAQYDDAEGVILRFPARITRDEAREIGVQFPGWHVWYGAWSETWNAHREGEEPYLGPGTVAGRASMVSFCLAGKDIRALTVEFATELAREAGRFAAEVERMYAVQQAVRQDGTAADPAA